jgi:hypothetical protein
MLPLKIRCQNCSNSGEIKDTTKFSYMGKYEGYSISECLKCGRRLGYKIPVFRRYGLMAIGLLIIFWGVYKAIASESEGMQAIFSGFLMGSAFLLTALKSEVKVKKSYRKEELPGI